eukprot:3933817-Rhodomonas_salina.1
MDSEPLTGNIVYKLAASTVNWGVKVLDQFKWITSNVGQLETLLFEISEELEEGCCRCRIRKGERCNELCEMKKVNAECAAARPSGHTVSGLGNCGNKRIQIFLRDGVESPVYLDSFVGVGLGLRAIRNIREDEVLGIYWGCVGPQRKTRKLTNGHSYVAEVGDGIWLDAAKEGSLMRYVNSSCNPNLRME